MNARHWELEAKEAVDKAAQVDAERDAARHEAVMARLEADAAGSARAQMEYKLTPRPACLDYFRRCPVEGGD